MIQNVKIRWESTWSMLSRAYIMKNTIKLWLNQDSDHLKVMTLTRVEWEQMKYIVNLLHSFQKIIESLSASSKSFIHKVWIVYNVMHAHLESQEVEIRSRTQMSWTEQLSVAILVVKNKLTKYYSAIAESQRIFFNVKVLLNLCVKLDFYSVSNRHVEILLLKLHRNLLFDRFMTLIYDAEIL